MTEGPTGTPEQGGYTIVALAARDLPSPRTADYCPACPAMCTIGYLARYIKADGQVSIRWCCDHCDSYMAGDLPKRLLGDVPLAQIPIRVDARIPDDDWPLCVVCGNPAFEFHHWAPRAIFPDWPHDVGAYLCTPHHKDWHDRMRKHGLRWSHELAEAT